jgi:hypothetical protein
LFKRESGMTKGGAVNDYFLSKGGHSTAADGRCAMEWVAYLAGEEHSDSPVCVSPVLQPFCINLNDSLPDEKRQQLRPYLARCIGTAGDGRDDERRWLCADWLIRTYTPAWLRLVPSLQGHADTLAALPPVLATENVDRAMRDLRAARSDAAAAWAAAGDAAGDAARDAARDVAWDVAWDAAWAVAWDAAWAVARDAAGDAAGDALKPTVDEIQDSLIGLLDWMLPTELVQLPVAADAGVVCSLP